MKSVNVRECSRWIGWTVCACSWAWCMTSGLSAQVTFTNQANSIFGNLNLESRSASLADIDDDGDLDLMFQGGVGAQKLYRNQLAETGTLSYQDFSVAVPSGLGPSWSAAWADYNGDRRVDVFVGQSNISDTGDVLMNVDGIAFANVSAAIGLDDPGFHQNVAWADFNNDRRLDLFLGMEGPTELHEIYQQRGNGAFVPVGAAAGIQQPPGIKAYGAAIGDTDGDGDLDLYISTCRTNNNIRNHFYENQFAQTGVLSFVDIADSNGTQFMRNSYGTELHDFDNDGDLDLFMVGADGQESKMWRNDGANQFTDTDSLRGHQLLSDIGGDLNGANVIDFDNDGDLDLFFHDHKPLNGASEARKLYRNDGNWNFTDVTVAAGIRASNEGSYDSTWGDLDRDGDLDLVATTNSDHAERVFISDASTNGNGWLFVELEGPNDNSTGVGASLYATLHAGTPDEVTLRREANTNAGTFNQSDLPVHFGLGAASQIDELRIEWRDGTVQTLLDVAANQYLTVFTNECDFDGSGMCGIEDINQMLALGPIQAGVVVVGGPNEQFDITGDGVVNLADLQEWLSQAGLSNGFGTAYLAGDANLDGVVDGQDFIVWNSFKFTSTLRWDQGDFNGDGVADGQDFLSWNASKFTGIVAVPEPASGWIAWWSAGIGLHLRRCRNGRPRAGSPRMA